eukprot:1865939-Rhodomonas_salina.1
MSGTERLRVVHMVSLPPPHCPLPCLRLACAQDCFDVTALPVRRCDVTAGMRSTLRLEGRASWRAWRRFLPGIILRTF